MILFPAIDLYGGAAVRLLRGDYAKMTVYSNDILSLARNFESAGAGYVHMVDLEGAKDGTTPNLEQVARVARETSLKVEVGGGIRTEETIERYLDAGVWRVILGTAAVNDPAFLERAVARYGDRIAVGADVRDGRIAVKGWLETSDVTLESFLDRMESLGVRGVICTDISKDGAMQGTNRELYRSLCGKYSLDITASGGVSSLSDITALRRMGLYGAILGKAYYTGAVNLEDALEAAR